MNAPVANSLHDAYRAAILRAHTNRLHIERDANDPMVCHAPSTSRPDHEPHTVTFVGPRWSDWTCSCEAGQHGRICLHMAGAVWLRKYGISSVTFKPLVAKEVASPAIVASAEDIALHQQLLAETHQTLGTTPPACQHDIFAYLEEGTACAQCGVWLAAPLSVRFNTIDPARLADALRAAEAEHAAEYPRGSRADIARCEAEAAYYDEVARANAAAYAAATAPPSHDPLDDCYGTIAVETYMHAGYAA